MADETAAFWEGYQSAQTRSACIYKEAGQDRTDWAKGFAAAVAENKAGKVWYKSNMLKAGVVCLLAGIVVYALGRIMPSGYESGVVMGAGSGISLSGLVTTFVRFTLKTDPLTLNNQSNVYGN